MTFLRLRIEDLSDVVLSDFPPDSKCFCAVQFGTSISPPDTTRIPQANPLKWHEIFSLPSPPSPAKSLVVVVFAEIPSDPFVPVGSVAIPVAGLWDTVNLTRDYQVYGYGDAEILGVLRLTPNPIDPVLLPPAVESPPEIEHLSESEHLSDPEPPPDTGPPSETDPPPVLELLPEIESIPEIEPSQALEPLPEIEPAPPIEPPPMLDPTPEPAPVIDTPSSPELPSDIESQQLSESPAGSESESATNGQKRVRRPHRELHPTFTLPQVSEQKNGKRLSRPGPEIVMKPRRRQTVKDGPIPDLLRAGNGLTVDELRRQREDELLTKKLSHIGDRKKIHTMFRLLDILNKQKDIMSQCAKDGRVQSDGQIKKSIDQVLHIRLEDAITEAKEMVEKLKRDEVIEFNETEAEK
jgi:hypothetical protein